MSNNQELASRGQSIAGAALMSISTSVIRKCWIRLEDLPTAEELEIAARSAPELHIHALTTAAIQKVSVLKELLPGVLKVFANNDFSDPLTPQTLLSSLTDESPLVIRYPLSNDTIIAHVSFCRSSFDTRIRHSTCVWHTLQAKA